MTNPYWPVININTKKMLRGNHFLAIFHLKFWISNTPMRLQAYNKLAEKIFYQRKSAEINDGFTQYLVEQKEERRCKPIFNEQRFVRKCHNHRGDTVHDTSRDWHDIVVTQSSSGAFIWLEVNHGGGHCGGQLTKGRRSDASWPCNQLPSSVFNKWFLEKPTKKGGRRRWAGNRVLSANKSGLALRKVCQSPVQKVGYNSYPLAFWRFWLSADWLPIYSENRRYLFNIKKVTIEWSRHGKGHGGAMYVANISKSRPLTKL